jgi:ribosomal protein L37AE/L43A
MKQTNKAQCPYCQSPNVAVWDRSDATRGDRPSDASSGPDEIWTCKDCGEGFIKTSARSQ